MTAIEFLKRAADGKHRIVSSGDLHVMQISEMLGSDQSNQGSLNKE